MDQIIWKIKQLFRKMIPIVIIGVLAWGGFSLYKQGVFKRGIGATVSSALQKVPYFGSRFKHYSFSDSGTAYSKPTSKHLSRRVGKKHHSKQKKSRRHRKHR